MAAPGRNILDTSSSSVIICSVARNRVFTRTLRFIANANSYLPFWLNSFNSLLVTDERKSAGSKEIQPEIPVTTAFTRRIVAFKEN
jgi:hypothetical protein